MRIIEGRIENDTGRAGRRARRGFGFAAVAAAAVVLNACASSSDNAERAQLETAAAESMTAAAAPADAVIVEEGEVVASPATPPADGAVAVPAALPAGRDIIVTIDVAMISENLQKAVQAITKSAGDNGGYVAATDINYDANADTGSSGDDDSSAGPKNGDVQAVDNSYAKLTIRVPATATAAFVETLNSAGTVVSSTQSTQDVTGQLTDLDIRIANTRDSIASIRALLANATELTDIVYLEEELSNRVTTLEQLEAQQRGLTDQAALSTVTISIRPPRPAEVVVEVVPEDQSVGAFFRRGWNAFTETVGVLVRLVAVTLPFLVTGIIIAFVFRRIARWNRRRRPVPQRLTTPPVVTNAYPRAEQAQTTRSEAQPHTGKPEDAQR